MKIRIILFIMAIISFICVSSVSADESIWNPSVYSSGRIVKDLPSFWTANPAEIQEYLKQYPDLTCAYYSFELEAGLYDQVVCVSVNNKWSRDVIINFFFTGSHAGMTKLQSAVFTIGTPHSEDVQEVFEELWIPGSKPAHKTGDDEFYEFLPSVIFYADDTIVRYNLPSYETEGLDYMTIDIRDMNALTSD